MVPRHHSKSPSYPDRSLPRAGSQRWLVAVNFGALVNKFLSLRNFRDVSIFTLCSAPSLINKPHAIGGYLYFTTFPSPSILLNSLVLLVSLKWKSTQLNRVGHRFPPVFHIKTQQRHVGGGMKLLPIYQKPNMSRPAKRHETYPYLLRGLRVTRPNQIYFLKMNTGGTLRHLNEWMTAMRDFSVSGAPPPHLRDSA